MADASELPPSVGIAIVCAQVPEEGAKFSRQCYRNLLETAVLDVPDWADGLQLPFLVEEELIPVRTWLALMLAMELGQQPLRPSDAAEAVYWYSYADAVRKTAPAAWAWAQTGMGNTWMRRSDVGRGEAVSNAVAALERALAAVPKDKNPEGWAAAVVGLGDAQKQIEPNGIDLCISTFQTAIESQPASLGEFRRGLLRSSLAGALFRRGERTGRSEDVMQAIAIYTEELNRGPVSDQLRAIVGTNLGAALGLASGQAWTDGWWRAVQVLEDALGRRDPRADPVGWAETAGNLGIVLKNRPDGDRLADLARARELFEQCIGRLEIAKEWWKWAAGQNNLGSVLIETPTGDTDEMIDAAVAAFDQARRVWTQELHPLEWALTTSRMANAILKTTAADARSRAADLFRAALDSLDRQKNPVSWARVNRSLASFELRSSGADRAQDLRESVARYEQSIEVFMALSNRYDAASSQHNLGLARSELGRLQGDPSMIQAAFAAFAEARNLRSAVEVPWDWATTTLAIANLHLTLGQPGPAEGYYREALDVLRVEGESRWVLAAASGLGRACALRHGWDEAAAAFDIALKALDEIFMSPVLREGRERQLAMAGTLVSEAAYAVARRGDRGHAVEVLEHGRGRLLGEALQRRYDPYAARAGTHPEEYAGYRTALANLEVAEGAALRLQDREDLPDEDRYRQQAEEAIRQQLKRSRSEVARLDRILKEKGPAAELHTSLPVAHIVSAPDGSAVLLTDHNETEVVWVPTVTSGDIDALVRGDGSNVTGLLVALQHGGIRREKALAGVQGVMTDLMKPLGDALIKANRNQVCLVPCGGLAVLPLHAALLDGDDVFADRFVVSYAPSMAILAACERSLVDRQGVPASVMAVSDPLRDLRFGACEAADLLSRTGGRELPGPDATRQAVVSAMGEAGLVHFACHGNSVPRHPLRSHLVLADGNLSLLDLSISDGSGSLMPDALLVVASACQTAVVEGEELPDEYVGLPAGFLMCGVPGYIGTLWPADDVPASLITIRMYESMFPGDDSPGLVAADALRRAQSWVRHLTGRDFVTFAESHPTFGTVASQQVALAAQLPDDRIYDQPSAWAAQVFVGAGAPFPVRASA